MLFVKPLNQEDEQIFYQYGVRYNIWTIETFVMRRRQK